MTRKLDLLAERLRPTPGYFLSREIRAPAQAKTFDAEFAARMAELCAEAAASRSCVVQRTHGVDTFCAMGGGDLFELLVSEDPLRLLRETTPAVSRMGDNVWLGGHGLGAAWATFTAIESIRQGTAPRALYTFGSPRVCDSTMVPLLRLPVFRVVANMDVVAEVPPPWRYQHVGRHLLLREDGVLLDSPTPLQRLPSLLRQSAWLVRLLRKGLHSGHPSAVFDLFEAVLQDHCLPRYVTQLRALRPQ